MKTIKDIESARQAKISDMLSELGVIFAFCQEQFDRSRIPGVTYVSGGCGIFIPQDNVQAFNDRCDRIIHETNEEFRENVTMDQYISHQLANYEASYTYDISEAYEAVQPVYPECTREDMWRVLHRDYGQE